MTGVRGGSISTGDVTVTRGQADAFNSSREAEISGGDGGKATIGGDLTARILGLLEAGFSQKDAAERLNLSESMVSRLLAASRSSDGAGPALEAVDRFVDTLGQPLEAEVAARVEALRALAMKLDWTTRATTGTAAMAAASLAKEYRALLDELRQSSTFDELVEALLADA